MQDRYAGDFGDYVKLALLRTLSEERRLGIAWYRHPDQSHNGDGRHTTYLHDPEKWRRFDPELFDVLSQLVAQERSIGAIESSGVIAAAFYGVAVPCGRAEGFSSHVRRTSWFGSLLHALHGAELIFADPDNGLVNETATSTLTSRHAKQIFLKEALALATGRVAVVYHHNTRFKGGHDREVDYWLRRLGNGAFAIRANAYACRTFFVLNPDIETRRRATIFCQHWVGAKVRLQLLSH